MRTRRDNMVSAKIASRDELQNDYLSEPRRHLREIVERSIVADFWCECGTN